MSAVKRELIRRSVCATCLSQGRTLFPVPVSMLSYGLTVYEQDRVCWECHHFVMKIGAFKTKALRAQSILSDFIKGKRSDIKTLSSLGVSTGLFLQISSPSDYIKQEKPVFTKVIKEEVEESGYEVPCDEAIKPSSEVIGGEISNSKANEDEVSSDEWQEEEDKNQTLSRKTGRPKKHKQIIIFDNFYSEKKMSEEEMWEWRERKKKSDYYLSSIPTFRCETCILPFDSSLSLRNHMKTHSEAAGNISCNICEQRCNGEFAIAEHKKIHYRLLSCRYCAHEWDDVNAMREHGQEVHNVPVTSWQCALCLQEYPSNSWLKRHYESHRHRLRVARCHECGKQVRVHNMPRHVRLHRSPAPPDILRCEVCGKRYRGGRGGLKNHMRVHEKNVDADAYCIPCGVQFHDKVLYRNHLKNSRQHSAEQERKYECGECGNKFRLKSCLKSHIKNKHSTTNYPCHICGKVYQSKAALCKHERFTHEGVAPVKNHVCDYCGKAFTTKHILLSHINTHTGARPHVCKLCGASFGHKSALYLHGRYKHKIAKKTDGKTDDQHTNVEKTT